MRGSSEEVTETITLAEVDAQLVHGADGSRFHGSRRTDRARIGRELCDRGQCFFDLDAGEGFAQAAVSAAAEGEVPARMVGTRNVEGIWIGVEVRIAAGRED